MSRVWLAGLGGAALVTAVCAALVLVGAAEPRDAVVVGALLAVALLQCWALRRTGAAYRVGSRTRADLQTLGTAVSRLDRRVEDMAALMADRPRDDVVRALAEVQLSLDGLVGATHADLRLLAEDSTRAAARAEDTAERVGAAQSAALAQLEGRLVSAVGAVRGAHAGFLTEVRQDLRAEYRQVSALRQLEKLLPDPLLLAHARGWSASPDVLLTLLGEVAHRAQRGPVTVVECGSGVSTVYLAALLRHLGTGGRVVALEHDEEFRRRTREALALNDLQEHADVRLAPLERVDTADGEAVRWYAPGTFVDLRGVGVVFVDGPPQDTGPCARYPAAPLLREHLSADAVLVVDDADRPGEREAIDRWVEELGASVQLLPDHEKGCALVTLGVG